MALGKTSFGDFCPVWNPWFGCSKVSDGCKNCYIFPNDNKFINIFCPLDATDYPKGTFVTVGLRTDVFLKEADELRPLMWETIKKNPDLIFSIYTKRIERVEQCLPSDWEDGYDNVIIQVSVENQEQADIRIPYLISLKAKHKWIACSPMLEQIDLKPYLSTGEIEEVSATGERDTHFNARPTYFNWIKDLVDQCKNFDIRFSFLYCGSNFILPTGQIIKNHPQWGHNTLEESLGLYYYKPITFNLKTITKTF